MAESFEKPKNGTKFAVETALEPDLPIVDAHHHLWDTPHAGGFSRYNAEDILADMFDAGHNVIATVFVDARTGYRESGPEEFRPVGETTYAAEAAATGARRGGRGAGLCAGIVSFAELRLGARAGEVLDAHMAQSPRFRGIRYMTAFDESIPPIYGAEEPGIMLREDFREGFAQLAPRGLSFDSWMFHPQLPELVDLARAFPETNIILDHLGGPLGTGRYADRKADAFEEWRSSMREVARCPNVTLKLGTLNMHYAGLLPAPGVGSEVAARVQRDHVLAAIDLFGPDRCMVESNFPVDGLTISYGVMWNTIKRITAGFTPRERRQMFVDTAVRAYRLPAEIAART